MRNNIKTPYHNDSKIQNAATVQNLTNQGLVDQEILTFTLSIMIPDGDTFQSTIKMIIMPGENGIFGVLHGHENMICKLRSGIIQVYFDDNNVSSFKISDGIVRIYNNTCNILTELCEKII